MKIPQKQPLEAARRRIVQRTSGPPLASEILAKFKAPQPAGAVQRKPGPPPMANEILAKFHQRTTPAVRNNSQSGRPDALQRKAGPPPLASEILARFGPGIANRMAAGQGFAQMKPGSGAQRRVPATAIRNGAAQRYKVDGVTYSSLEHLRDRNIADGKKLFEKVCEDARFTSKTDAVKDRLSQYLVLYPAQEFSLHELKIFLEDDIIRQKIPMDPDAEWSPQTLLTTKEGVKRVRGTGRVPQAFPSGAEIKFYRTMGFANFAEMMGVAMGGRTPAAVVRELPYENTNIKTKIVDKSKLGNHLGDYKQARSYFGNAHEAQVMVEFRYKVSTFFDPANLALPAAGLDDLKAVLQVEYPGRQYAVATANEGTNNAVPGLKSENRGLYSVGLSANAMTVFINNAESVKVMEYHIP